ncbi:LPS export ABC transporter permease LptG [bacterium]|nr:LPS export ABC transporter permease LptG [bacterium]
MKKLDRYVARRFFSFFLLAMLAAVAIYLVVDPIENLDDFLDKGVSKQDILRYYLFYTPYIIYLVYPVAVLLGTMFSMGGLSGNNELLAMSASGVPLYRHLVNLALIGLMLSGFMFWWGESLVPEMNRQRLDIWRLQVKKRMDWRVTEQGHVYLQEGPERVIHMDLYQPRIMTGHGVDMYEYDGSRIEKRYYAKKLVWFENRWVMHDVLVRDFSGKTERIENLDRLPLDLEVLPEDLVEMRLDPEEMGLEELKRFVERLEQAGGHVHRWVVDIHTKVANPFAGFIIILFGVPVSAVRRRSGFVFGVTISLLVAFIYFGFQQIGKVLGYKEVLDPWLGAWLANIVFGLVGLILLIRTPK